MASVQLHPGDSRHRPRDPSYDQSTRNVTSKHPTKRLFSTRLDSTDPTGASENHIINGEKSSVEIDYSPSGKRHRSGDWPLTSTSPNIEASARTRHQKRGSQGSPPLRRSSSSRVHASKFVEGSMDDRISQKPPATYIGDDEDARDRYENEQNEKRRMGSSRRSTQHPNFSAGQSSATDTSRHSSIFRFGKSLAASFNPTNWKIWSKDTKQDVSYETEQQRILRERQDKAEQIYKELKKTGYFQDGAHPGTLQRAADQKKPPTVKHDSGIDLSHHNSAFSKRTTTAEKRMGRIFVDSTSLQQSSRGGSTRSSIASASLAPTDVPSPRRSFQLTRPFASSARRSLEVSSNMFDYNSDNSSMRKIPSRKDMQKQQKLVKRVSDLEGKLEAARRQLSEALGEPVPSQSIQAGQGRPRFVPGTLPTLLSERLLCRPGSDSGDENENESPIHIGKALSIDPKLNASCKLPAAQSLTSTPGSGQPIVTNSMGVQKCKPEQVAVPSSRPAPQLAPSRQVSNKRKPNVDDNSSYKPASDTDDEEFIRPTKRRSPPQRKARKLQKTLEERSSKPDLNTTEPQNYRHGAVRYSSSNNLSSPRKLRKINGQPAAQQSVSPPPSSEFTGWESRRPTMTPDRTKSRNVLQDDEEPYSAVPDVTFDVPPMPKVPKEVRLPNGELIKTKELQVKLRKGGEMGWDRNGPEDEQERHQSERERLMLGDPVKKTQNKKSFEWPEDVF